MDPISLILAALAAGAADAAKDTASEAIKDAYSGLKSLVKRHFGGKPASEAALDEFENDQDTWEKPLKKGLAESGAADDKEVLALAQRLLEITEAGPVAASKYSVDAHASTGVAIGDHAQATVHQSDRG